MKGQLAFLLGQTPCFIHGIVVELPLQPQLLTREIVIGSRQCNPCFFLDIGLSPTLDRLTDTVHIHIHTDYRPSVFPVHGLQMHHPAQRVVLLEMIEPPFSVRRIDYRALVRSVDAGHSPFEHHFLFIRSIDVLGAKYGLPATPHATFGNAQVIITVVLVNLGTFGDRTCVHGASFVQQLCSVGTHAVDDDRTCSPDASPQIGIAVLVPKRTRVFPFRYFRHMSQRCPWSFGIFRIRHEQAFIGCAEEHPKLTIVVTDGRCPRTSCIAGIVLPSRKIKSVVKLRYQPPIHHIFRFQYLHPEVMKIGCHHIVTIVHPNYIRVGIISIQNGIHVSTVSLISPCLQRFLCMELPCKCKGTK